jgi:hypothetical protein
MSEFKSSCLSKNRKYEKRVSNVTPDKSNVVAYLNKENLATLTTTGLQYIKEMKKKVSLKCK